MLTIGMGHNTLGYNAEKQKAGFGTRNATAKLMELPSAKRLLRLVERPLHPELQAALDTFRRQPRLDKKAIQAQRAKADWAEIQAIIDAHKKQPRLDKKFIQAQRRKEFEAYLAGARKAIIPFCNQ